MVVIEELSMWGGEVNNRMDFNEYTELYHYGVLGMKWGIRRYQNEDGTLTNRGKRRLAKKISKDAFRKRPKSSRFGSGLNKDISEQIDLLDTADVDAALSARNKRNEAFKKVQRSIFRGSSNKNQKAFSIAEDEYIDQVKKIADKILDEYGSVIVGSRTYVNPAVLVAVQNVLEENYDL